MANTLSVQRSSTAEMKTLLILMALSGSYATGGETINLTSLGNPKFLNDARVGYPGNITDYEVLNCPLGYEGVLTKGSNLTNWKLQFELTGAALSGALAELPAGAYPAPLVTGPVTIRIMGPQLQM